MPLILVIIALCVLKYFAVWRFAEMSWWWVVGVMAFAFIWFEFVEKIFGWDKKKAHNVDEQRRKDRVKQSFDKRK